MSKCESNVDELIVPELTGIPGTVSSKLSDFRDWRGDTSVDISDLCTAVSNPEVCGLTVTARATPRSPLRSAGMSYTAA